jgi:hypothetical protein
VRINAIANLIAMNSSPTVRPTNSRPTSISRLARRSPQQKAKPAERQIFGESIEGWRFGAARRKCRAAAAGSRAGKSVRSSYRAAPAPTRGYPITCHLACSGVASSMDTGHPEEVGARNRFDPTSSQLRPAARRRPRPPGTTTPTSLRVNGVGRGKPLRATGQAFVHCGRRLQRGDFLPCDPRPSINRRRNRVADDLARSN